MSEKIILKDVSFRYKGSGEKNGVSHIDLSIKAGEVVLIAGTSGCGKTTITRLINGLIPHFYEGESSGDVLIKNRGVELGVKDTPLYALAGVVGSVFQNPRSQFFNVDTDFEIAFGCENLGMEEDVILKRVEQKVDAFQLYELLGRSIFELSGGEKQRLAVACAIASGRKIVVFDEPTSGFDLRHMKEVAESLKMLKDQKKSVFVITHDPELIRYCCTYEIRMEDGCIKESGYIS